MYKVTDFCLEVKKYLPHNKYKIIGEVTQPKYSQGNLYFNLKDTTSNIKCILWKNKIDKNININDGDKIIIEVKIDFYTLSGSLNFIVDNIIENQGIGDLHNKYNNIKKIFEEKGYFKNANKLGLPLIIKNIVILTSENGAAIKDFLFNLENNNSKICYTIIDVPVQGANCHKTIINKLDDIYNNKIEIEKNIDAIIITRGGGSFQDLFGFSEPELIEHIYTYKKYPIISAIGHQVDNPLLDFVSDIVCPTPSLAAQFLIDHNINFINKLNTIRSNFQTIIKNEFFSEQKRLNEINNKLKSKIDNLIDIVNTYKISIEKELYKQKEILQIIKNKLDNKINGIHIFKNDLEILNPNNILIGDELYLQWNNKKFKISILL